METKNETRKVRHPEIEVQLTGEDGNAFAIMGKVRKALQRGGVDKEEIDEYMKLAMSGDYNNLLNVSQQFVTVL